MGREHRAKFIASKLNINGNIFSSNKEELIDLIPEAILMKPKIKRNSWTWEFAELNVIKEEDTEFIVGNLVRSRIETVNIVENEKITTFQIPKPVAYNSLFLYDSLSEILIFEEPAKINREEFIKMFEKLVYSANLKIGEVKIKLIPTKEQVKKRIMEIEYLTKVEFDLIPPNFHKKETFTSLNDIIQDENATRMKTTLENKNGLNKQGKFINEGIEMVSSAYGEVVAYGYDNVPSRVNSRKTRKQRKSFNSKDLVNIKKIKADSEKTLISKLKDFALEMRKILM